MTDLISRKKEIDSYHNNAQHDDEGYYASGWGSRESQNARFKALIDLSDFKGGSIIDYGCGSGDLIGFIQKLGFETDYWGLDQNPQMLSLARCRYQGQFSEIEIDTPPSKKADYVFASGIFQFQDSENPIYYKYLLDMLFASANKCLAVNFLSAQRASSEKDAKELYLTPCEVADLASGLSKFWRVDHSYHLGGGDVTVAVFKDNGSEWARPKKEG